MMGITLRDIAQLASKSGNNLMIIRFKRQVSFYNAGTLIEVNTKSTTEGEIEELTEVLDEPVNAIFAYRDLITVDVG